MKSTIKAVEVIRDDYGFWFHPDLPNWNESTKTADMRLWAKSVGLTSIDFVCFELEAPEALVDRYIEGEEKVVAEWEPECKFENSFLLSIHENENGVFAMYAIK